MAGRVVVASGGRSLEREISLRSGRRATDALQSLGYDAVAIDYRIGPFAFTVIYHQALVVCLNPLPEGTGCSIDEDGLG